MKKSLTEGAIRALKAPSVASKVHYDGHGLGLLVTSKGGKSFSLDYSGSGGKRRRMVLGQWPAMSLDEARKEASHIRARIKQSVKERRIDPSLPLYDPLDAKREEKRKVTEQAKATRDAHTLDSLIDLWLENHARPFKRTTSLKTDQTLCKKIRAALGAKKLTDVTRKDVRDLKREMVSTPVLFNRTFSLLRALFNYAVDEELLTMANPCRALEKFKENARRVTWDADKQARLYAALAAHRNQNAANIIRLLLWTGSRSSEVTGARWAEFDLERGWWAKPSERMKTKKNHDIPLNPLALNLLRELHQTKQGEHVFPKQKLNLRRFWIALRKKADLGLLRVHDLRHVFASTVLERGQPIAAISKLLGHSSTVMTQRYAHLSDKTLLAATNAASEAFAPTPKPAKVIALSAKRREERTRRSA